MKIFVSNLNESWIVDRFRNEWIEENREILQKKLKKLILFGLFLPGHGKKFLKNT